MIYKVNKIGESTPPCLPHYSVQMGWINYISISPAFQNAYTCYTVNVIQYDIHCVLVIF